MQSPEFCPIHSTTITRFTHTNKTSIRSYYIIIISFFRDDSIETEWVVTGSSKNENNTNHNEINWKARSSIYWMFSSPPPQNKKKQSISSRAEKKYIMANKIFLGVGKKQTKVKFCWFKKIYHLITFVFKSKSERLEKIENNGKSVVKERVKERLLIFLFTDWRLKKIEHES